MEGGIPFEVKLKQPSRETITAMLEAERIAKGCRETRKPNSENDYFPAICHLSRKTITSQMASFMPSI